MTQTRPTITLVNGTENERLLERQLLTMFDRYELGKWFYTEHVQLEEGVIPHSHPVLTLAPRKHYLTDLKRILAVYLHEQMHWFSLLDEMSRDNARIGTELRTRYPNLPVDPPDGCGSEFSNYLHIVVNFFEYQALRELLSDDRARAVLGGYRGYKAIYAVVLRDYAELEQLFTKCGLILPEQPPLEKRFIPVKPR